MPQEAYTYWYNWSDLRVLETLLRQCFRPDLLVVEVAAGPNIAVPHVLKRNAMAFGYVSLDLQKAHIRLQRKGVGNTNVNGVVGDATRLPFRHRCVDMFIFHHAVDDILETKGFGGVKASIEEALRTLKQGAYIVFSHCVFSYDPYTLDIDLSDVQAFLQHRIKGRFQRIDGPGQSWLLVQYLTPR